MTGWRRRDLLGHGLAVGSASLIAPGALTAAGRSPEAQPSPLLHGLTPRDTAAWSLPQTDPSRLLMDDGWRFHEGDITVPPPATHHETYLSVKAGNARGAAAIDWDDSDWQDVRVPHDWASAQPFSPEANVSQGYRSRGIGWYRRTFRLPESDRDKRLELQFGGIATAATIWINGNLAARNNSAYNAIHVDITPFVRFGEADNVIAIRVDANQMEGWWYEGAGLYRHVWLARRAAVSIATDGVHCDPRRRDDGGWQVPVMVDLESVAEAAREVTITAALCDPEGRIIARQQAVAEVAALGKGQARLLLAAGEPRLWSIENPQLYTLDVTVSGVDGEDVRHIPIGLRTIRFDAAKGFFLNDAPVKLKGVCLHLDHAGVGVAVPDALLAWRLARLKDMGCNAIRCSHNAQAEEFYALCDRMGFLVMDENRIFNPAPENIAQLQWLVRAHRNHPSIIMWSVFNEEPMQGTREGVQMVRRMRAAVRALDDSRPVTAAMNGAFHDPVNVSQVVDVVGFNYYPGDYERFHAAHPDLPIISSEDTSALMTRGAYASDPASHVITAMDTEATSWGATHRDAWREIASRPFVAGGFAWTGFDYHGEPTPHAWPTISSFFGILDLCGFAKTAYDIRRAQWIDDRPVIGLAPHWTWPGREGQLIDLLVTANAGRVRLKRNGRIVGEADSDRIMGATFRIEYQPGMIEAEALAGDRVVARTAHRTAGPPVALRLIANRAALRGDGEDVAAITAYAVDAQGNFVPDADTPLRFMAEGGEIIGLGNGDPNSHESEKGHARRLFNGLAQVIVQAGASAAKGSKLLIAAQGEGLRPARLALPLQAALPRAAVAVRQPEIALADWRVSPPLANRPDPALRPEAGDNNLWAFVRAPWQAEANAAPMWRVLVARIPERRALAQRGGTIVFEAVSGIAELWADGAALARKSEHALGPLSAVLPAGTREIAVLLLSRAGEAAGLAGPVRIALKGPAG